MNDYSRQDDWSFLATASNFKFFMLDFFNFDIYTTNTNGSQEEIGKFYFRLQTDTIVHHRILYGLFDWLSDVGGVSRAVFVIILSIYGSFAHFTSRIEIMLHVYSDKGVFKVDEKPKPREEFERLPA